MKSELTFEEFRQEVVDWSDALIRRRIKNDGFPAKYDRSKKVWSINRAEMEVWFDRKKIVIRADRTRLNRAYVSYKQGYEAIRK